jgi:hypothetical protein
MAGGVCQHAIESLDSAGSQIDRSENARRREALQQGARSRERNRPMSFGRGAISLVFLGLEFFDVRLKLWEGCPAQKVKANHLIGSLVRLSTGVEQNQQASDDRQVHLDLDTATDAKLPLNSLELTCLL